MNKLKVFTKVVYDKCCPRARLDLFRPLAGDRLPMVTLIHGGGWSGGTKESYWPVCIWLAERGWAALTIEYRLYPEVRWPDILLDSIRACAYVSERAEQFGIDPTLTVTWGSSAGGHLALMFQATREKWLDEGIVKRLPEVAGTVAYCPVLTVTGSENLKEICRDLMGGHAEEEVYPLHCPPELFRDVLVLHGDADETVPLTDSHDFTRQLESAGINTRLEVIEGAPHGYGYHILTDIQKISLEHAKSYLERVLPLN